MSFSFEFLNRPIKKYSNKVDKVIFLGDYLDPYSYEITENQKLMECSNFGDSESLLKMLDDIVSLKKDIKLICPDDVWNIIDNITCIDDSIIGYDDVKGVYYV